MQPIREEISGSVLPERLRRKVNVRLDEKVMITIRSNRQSLVKKLLNISDRATKETKANGLTDEKFDQLLNES
jgi:hypothetical protein